MPMMSFIINFEQVLTKWEKSTFTDLNWIAILQQEIPTAFPWILMTKTVFSFWTHFRGFNTMFMRVQTISN